MLPARVTPFVPPLPNTTSNRRRMWLREISVFVDPSGGRWYIIGIIAVFTGRRFTLKREMREEGAWRSDGACGSEQAGLSIYRRGIGGQRSGRLSLHLHSALNKRLSIAEKGGDAVSLRSVIGVRTLPRAD